MLKVRPARGGDSQVRSSRPRPAVWCSATITVPSTAPWRAAAARCAFVEAVCDTTRNSVQRAPSRTTACRSAAWFNGGRDRSEYDESGMRAAYAYHLYTAVFILL